MRQPQPWLAAGLTGVLTAVMLTACQAWAVSDSGYITPSPGIVVLTPVTVTAPPPAPTTARATAPVVPLPAQDDYPTLAADAALTSGQGPVIEYFVSTPTEVNPGETALLFWSSKQADTAVIYRLDADGERGREWEVRPEGSLTVTPRSLGQVEIYVLVVSNSVTTAEQTLSIGTRCPYTWFFNPPPEDQCPAGEPASLQASLQRFEYGLMAYLPDTNEIVVLFDDGPAPDEPDWLLLPNPFGEGMPEDDPSLAPPEGLTQPRRGFGVVWREHPTVRERLGWALSDEVIYEMLIQRVTLEDATLLYFSDETGAVITFGEMSAGWQVAGFR